MDSLFNAEYIRRLIEGHSAIERHFYDHFGAVLTVKIRRDPRTRELSDDAKQETFLRVLRNLRRNPNLLETPEKLGAYVIGVCNHVLQELSRSEGRYRGMDGTEDLTPDPRRNAVDEAVWQSDRALVQDLLDELGEKDRRLLVALFLEEQDKDEVCREFGVDRNYLRVLMHRAIGRCRSRLESKKSSARGAIS